MARTSLKYTLSPRTVRAATLSSVVAIVGLFYIWAPGYLASAHAGQDSFITSQDPFFIARSAATLAGGADFCKADPEDVDSFISKSEGLITSFSRDKAEAIFARLEFKNLLTASKAKEPTIGCQEHMQRFQQALSALL